MMRAFKGTAVVPSEGILQFPEWLSCNGETEYVFPYLSSMDSMDFVEKNCLQSISETHQYS